MEELLDAEARRKQEKHERRERRQKRREERARAEEEEARAGVEEEEAKARAARWGGEEAAIEEGPSGRGATARLDPCVSCASIVARGEYIQPAE